MKRYATLLITLILVLVISSYQETAPVKPKVVTVDSIVSDTLNNTYIVDNEDTTITIWNSLKSKDIECTLIFGNLGLNDEPVTQCNRLWVVSGSKAIDSGNIYTDSQHFEGYDIPTPQQYRVIKDALDDYQEAKTRYTLAPTNQTKLELQSANERVIGEIP